MTAIAPADITADEARKLTDRIKVGVEAVWHLVEEAYQSRAWAALGYTSWDDYSTREFGTSRIRIPREERPEVVSSMREAGMSVRAIASGTGLSYGVVHRELSGDPNGSPDVTVEESTAPLPSMGEHFADAHTRYEDAPLTDEHLAASIDAELRASDPGYRETAQAATEDIGSTDTPDPEPAPAATVTGTDGKKYTVSPPAPRHERRKPITDQATTLGWDMRKAADKVAAITADDRFRSNKEQVTAILRGHLLHVAETVAAVLDDLA